METAIRWSSTSRRGFLLADTVGNRLQHCEVTSASGTQVEHRIVAEQDTLPAFTAFDWCRTNNNLVAIGTDSSTRIIALDTPAGTPSTVQKWSNKHSRQTNSIAWNSAGQVACGLDRNRLEGGVLVYDTGNVALNSPPLVSFAHGEAVSSIKFGPDDPNLLLCGTPLKGLRLFDIRGMLGEKSEGGWQHSFTVELGCVLIT